MAGRGPAKGTGCRDLASAECIYTWAGVAVDGRGGKADVRIGYELRCGASSSGGDMDGVGPRDNFDITVGA